MEKLKKYKNVFNEDRKSEQPTTLIIGSTYITNDGGTITINNIKVNSLHMPNPEIYISYSYKDPKGKKGKGHGNLNHIKQYFS